LVREFYCDVMMMDGMHNSDLNVANFMNLIFCLFEIRMFIGSFFLQLVLILIDSTVYSLQSYAAF